jgi:hypothetical protein
VIIYGQLPNPAESPDDVLMLMLFMPLESHEYKVAEPDAPLPPALIGLPRLAVVPVIVIEALAPAPAHEITAS